MKTINKNVDLSKLFFKALPEWLAEVRVNGNFYCHRNLLTSLKGCPERVGGSFLCSDNQLTSLEGSPKEVGGDFWCYNNQLTSLKGCPKEVGRDFDCWNNPGKFTVEDVRKVCNVKGSIYV